MTPVVHIEMYDGQLFCGFRDYDYDGVEQHDWQGWDGYGRIDASAPVTAFEPATCVACLQRLVKLGEAAGRRLKELP